MSTNDTKLLDVLVLCSPLAVDALSTLGLLCHACIAKGGFAYAPEVGAIEWEESTLDKTLSDESAHGALLLENA